MAQNNKRATIGLKDSESERKKIVLVVKNYLTKLKIELKDDSP